MRVVIACRTSDRTKVITEIWAVITVAAAEKQTYCQDSHLNQSKCEQLDSTNHVGTIHFQADMQFQADMFADMQFQAEHHVMSQRRQSHRYLHPSSFHNARPNLLV